jgi:tetrahydromethanopterin S-methyltransferase subunit G
VDREEDYVNRDHAREVAAFWRGYQMGRSDGLWWGAPIGMALALVIAVIVVFTQ